MIEFSPSAAFLSAVILYWFYYRIHYGKKPEVYWKEGSKWSAFLNKNVKSLKLVYWSFYLMPGGKLQTIVAALLPKKDKISFNKESVTTPDGGQFILAWSNFSDIKETNKPIVFIYPGLVSTTESNYVKTLTKAVEEKKYAVVVLVNRGLECPCLTGKAFCATHTADIAQALPIVKERYPTSPIVAIGISLGGVNGETVTYFVNILSKGHTQNVRQGDDTNTDLSKPAIEKDYRIDWKKSKVLEFKTTHYKRLVLMRYLAHSGSNSGLTAAFVYSCPFNPVVGSKSLEKWNNWLLYNVVLTEHLKKVYSRSRDKFSHIVDHDHLMNARSIREVDARFTAKVFGYESVDHYYEDSVITKKMFDAIRTPTLCLCANDDDFVPEKALPREDVSQTDFVALAVTNGGGHVGHLSGLNPFSTPYYIDMFVDFVGAVFEHTVDLPGNSYSLGL